MDKALVDLFSNSAPLLRTALLYTFVITLLTPQLLALFAFLIEANRSQRRVKRLQMLADAFGNLSSADNPEPARRLATLLTSEIDAMATLIDEGKENRIRSLRAPSTPWLWLRILVRLPATSLAILISIGWFQFGYSQIHYWRVGDSTFRDISGILAFTWLTSAILILFAIHHAIRLWHEGRIIVTRWPLTKRWSWRRANRNTQLHAMHSSR